MRKYDGRATRHRKPLKRRPPHNAPLADQQAYWEAVLAREGLTESTGLRADKLICIGGSREIEALQHAKARNYGCGGGKRAGKPFNPDKKADD